MTALMILKLIGLALLGIFALTIFIAALAMLAILLFAPRPFDGSDDSEFWQGWRPDQTDDPKA